MHDLYDIFKEFRQSLEKLRNDLSFRGPYICLLDWTTTYDPQNKRFKVQTLETRIKLKDEQGKKTLQTSCQCLQQQTNTNLHLNFHIMQPVNLNLQEIRAGCHMNMKSSTSTHIKPTHFFQFLFKRVNSTNNSVKYISLPMALPENTKSTEFSK